MNLRKVEVLCAQHEFGIYGGPAGSHLLALLKDARMPIVTTLHTIQREPRSEQRVVMAELIPLSDRLVVMTQKGAELLRENYRASEQKIDVIPHGIPDLPFMGPHFYNSQFY